MKEKIKKIEQALDSLLLDQENRVDRFDANYIDDFHFILKETHSIKKTEDEHNDSFNKLKKLVGANSKSVKELGETIKTIEGLNISKYKPKESDSSTKSEHKYDQTSSWDSAKDLKVNDQNKDKLNQLQVDYSVLSHANQKVAPSAFWNRDGLTDEKNQLFKDFCSGKKVLCIGPRWAEEISYISNTFNCEALGLDLFSNNKDLVKVGDMHDMPFEDNTFDVVYQKNTFNKSYNIRKCLDECVRVLVDGGVIISDEILGYNIGVNEIARTSINRNSWYTSYLDKRVDEILCDKEVSINASWADYAGLYAVKIKK